MTWIRAEYLLKGIFLGLLAFVALQSPGWEQTGRVGLWLVGGLGVALVLGAVIQLRQGFRFGGNVPAFLLFLLLENPLLVYAGLVFGLAGGALNVRNDALDPSLLTWCVLGGALLGYALYEVHDVSDPMRRLVVGLLAPAALVAIGLYLLEERNFYNVDRRMLGYHLLLGLPFFYLLTFTGMAEETEVEIAALCAGLGAGIYLLQFPANLPAAGFLIPVTLYYVYATRILPGLRTFKHVLRGYSYAEAGRVRQALTALRRAVELDPRNQFAREALWQVHRGLDVEKLAGDPETLGLLDFPLCLDRAAMLLVGRRTPNAEQVDEARRMLDLVEKSAPGLQSKVDYYRAALLTHQKQFDAAAEVLSRLLDPLAWQSDGASRRDVLFLAWQLALRLHPELTKRIGPAELDKPGRRMEAIAAVERHLAANPDDGLAQEIRRDLYSRLSEDDYSSALGDGTPPADFNHDHVEQLGLALIADAKDWERGAAYLRMAGRGLPHRGPTIFAELAEAYRRVGDREQVRTFQEQVKRSGLAVGVKQLDPEQRTKFFEVVKRSGDEAAAAGDLEQAIADYELYAQRDGSGVETLRTLADLYLRQGDALNGARIIETGLLFDRTDKDLLAKKDSAYYSVTPERLAGVADKVRGWFDVAYCIRKAKSLLDAKVGDDEVGGVLDWASHLVELARVMQPKNLAVQTLTARCHLRRGSRDEALRILEDVREATPSGTEEEDARFWACQHLGRLYLDELGRADLAVGALLDFKKSNKSGADTIYHLGRAYEAVGDKAKAMRCYEQVTAYEGHPLVWEAQDALRRLKGEG